MPATVAGVDAEAKVVAVARELLGELGLGHLEVRPGSDLERDLGLGSLERVELLTRLEKAFGVQLPDETLQRAERIAALVEAVGSAAPDGAPGWAEATASPDRAPSADGSRGEGIPRRPPPEVQTISGVARFRAEATGTAPFLHVLTDDLQATPVSYAALWAAAEEVASGLATRGVGPGDRVALMLPTCEGFFFGLLGIQARGAVPVPIYPPLRLDRLDAYLDRHARILQNAGAKLLVTDRQLRPAAGLLRDRVRGLDQVETVTALRSGAQGRGAVRPAPTDLGLIQYTSGSTGDPKGVALRHRNLVANCLASGHVAALSPQDVCISWLPLYHDMGLIGSFMTGLFHGIPLHVLSPLQFLARPERWLWALHRFGGTISPAPNFAYELCCRKISDAATRGLDLSTWRVAMNGSEPVRPETLRRFHERFSRHGFRAEAMMPVYGLAECSVAATFPPPGRAPRLDRVLRDRFTAEGEAAAVAGEDDVEDAATLTFVSAGSALPAHEVRVCAPREPDAEAPLPERREGRVLLRGPSIMAGYFRRPEQTAEVLRGGWLDTGDLGYLADGELYITGRAKDLVIKAGRNYHPHDIEVAAWTVEGVRKGCVVAFSIPDRLRGEAICVVAETRAPAAEHARIRAEIVRATERGIGTPADTVALVGPGTVPKTSSGTLRRRDTRQRYLAGDLVAPGTPGIRLWLRILGRSVAPRVRRGFEALGRVLYAALATSLGAAGLATGLALLRALPLSGRGHWRAVRALARGLGFITGLVPGRRGGALPSGGAVCVSNHGSYLDPVALVAILERPLRYTAKSSAFSVPLFGDCFRRLGTISMDRRGGSGSVASYDKAREALAAGDLVHIFPEGTFTDVDGLRPFRLGAFRLAAEAGVPIVPIAIRGLRRALRSERSTLRWGPVRVAVLPPIHPTGTGMRELAALRDRARQALAAASGEPTLDLVSAALPDGVTP